MTFAIPSPHPPPPSKFEWSTSYFHFLLPGIIIKSPCCMRLIKPLLFREKARLRRPKTREGHFLRLNQSRKPRMKSLWHPGYNVANFVIKFRVHNTRLSNSVLEGDRLMFRFHEYYFKIKIENLHLL